MGTSNSKNYTTYSYHIQKEISPNNFFLIWPSTDFCDYCFQLNIAENELVRLKLEDPRPDYRIIKCEVKVINGKVNKTGRFKIERIL